MFQYDEPKSQQNILLDHVILPRVLPQQKSCYTHEQALIDLMIENVGNTSAVLPHKTIEMMKRLKRVNSECTPKVVSQLINELRCPGDTFSMFVRKQNTAIIFYVPSHTEVNSNGEPNNIIVATFPACLRPSKIYKHDSDLEVK